MLSHDTARAVGLDDRGVIAPGCKADLNVVDMDRLHLHAPEVARDLPSGGRRLVQRAEGYAATIVGGIVVHRDGFPTGALPGRLVRGPQPAVASNESNHRRRCCRRIEETDDGPRHDRTRGSRAQGPLAAATALLHRRQVDRRRRRQRRCPSSTRRPARDRHRALDGRRRDAARDRGGRARRGPRGARRRRRSAARSCASGTS